MTFRARVVRGTILKSNRTWPQIFRVNAPVGGQGAPIVCGFHPVVTIRVDLAAIGYGYFDTCVFERVAVVIYAHVGANAVSFGRAALPLIRPHAQPVFASVSSALGAVVTVFVHIAMGPCHECRVASSVETRARDRNDSFVERHGDDARGGVDDGQAFTRLKLAHPGQTFIMSGDVVSTIAVCFTRYG